MYLFTCLLLVFPLCHVRPASRFWLFCVPLCPRTFLAHDRSPIFAEINEWKLGDNNRGIINSCFGSQPVQTILLSSPSSACPVLNSPTPVPFLSEALPKGQGQPQDPPSQGLSVLLLNNSQPIHFSSSRGHYLRSCPHGLLPGSPSRFPTDLSAPRPHFCKNALFCNENLVISFSIKTLSCCPSVIG